MTGWGLIEKASHWGKMIPRNNQEEAHSTFLCVLAQAWETSTVQGVVGKREGLLKFGQGKAEGKHSSGQLRILCHVVNAIFP